MPVHRLSALTWEEARALAGRRMVAILPLGALEAHGPHLPLDTDVVIAEAMARTGADRLAALGYEVLRLPPLVYAPAPFAAAFPGTVSIAPDALRGTIVGIAESLTRSGCAALAVANAHFDPAHVAAIRAAVETTRLHLITVFPDLTRRALAMQLSEEFQSGACHAGRYETSILLAEQPQRVRDDVRRGLSPVRASLSEAVRAGVTTFHDAGGDRAYFGFPADASAEEGAATVETLGSILAGAVAAEVPLVA